MENKKLMHILLRDVVELEQLVLDIRGMKFVDPLDVEFLLTRVSGIRHLLGVVAGETGFSSGEKPEEERATRRQEPPAPAPRQPQAADIQIPFGQSPPEPEEVSLIKSEWHPEKAVETGAPVIAPETGKTETTTEHSTTETEPSTFLPPVDLALGETEPSSHDKQVLGEKFVAGKSLNDLLLEKGTVDSRFSGMALPSLADAIRTNDRYLYCRELFEGNMEKLNETIAHIDAMGTIQEAATYLRDHYKWKKNETSLRFIDLVRRRFL